MDDSDVTQRDSSMSQDSHKCLKDRRNLYVKLQLDVPFGKEGQSSRSYLKGRASRYRPPTPTPEKKHVISSVTSGDLYQLQERYPQQDAMKNLTKHWLTCQERANAGDGTDRCRLYDVMSGSDLSDVSMDSDCVNHM